MLDLKGEKMVPTSDLERLRPTAAALSAIIDAASRACGGVREYERLAKGKPPYVGSKRGARWQENAVTDLLCSFNELDACLYPNRGRSIGECLPRSDFTEWPDVEEFYRACNRLLGAVDTVVARLDCDGICRDKACRWSMRIGGSCVPFFCWWSHVPGQLPPLDDNGLIVDIEITIDDGFVWPSLDPECASEGERFGSMVLAAGGVLRTALSAISGEPNWLEKALVLLKEHPDWPDDRVANEVRANPGDLQWNFVYQKAARIARGPRGG